MDDIYYVYIYLDPRKSGRFEYEDFSLLYEPFYVGKGKDDRYKQLCGRNDYFTKKINKIKKSGFEPIVIKINENLFENEAFDLEIELIKLIGRKKLNEGPLINLTDGGDGSSGYKWTDEQYEKLKTDWNLIEKTFEEKGYELLSVKDEYVNNETKLKYKHKKCGTEHEIAWYSFYNGDRGCPKCGRDGAIEKQKTDWDIIVKTFIEREYELKSTKNEYVNNETKLKYKHKKCGTEHEISWSDFYNRNHGCPKCGRYESVEKRKTDWDLIIKTFKEKGYELKSTKDDYINCDTKLKYKHKKCGTEHEISWERFYNDDQGCPKCGRDEVAEKLKTDWNLIEKTFKERGYELLSKEEDYINNTSKLKYRHKKCGTEHEVSWNDFYSCDNGCPLCGREQSTKKRRKNFNDIIKAFEDENFILLTKEEEYINNKQKLEYITLNGEYKYIRWNDFKTKYLKSNNNNKLINQ